jgi:subtilase family serine protease
MNIARRWSAVLVASALAALMLASSAVASGAHAAKKATSSSAARFAIKAPERARKGKKAHSAPTAPACTLPDGSTIQFFHCYTPQQIRSAYGVDGVAPLSSGPNYGQGQTIVLVDAYGSPTAASDLQHFHDTFFPTLPNPDFKQVFPQGRPNFHNACKKSQGLSGPCAAANWSGEATLDIEWAYSIAPEAHLILLAVPPAETEGVQGFPNLFKAMSQEIQNTPPGTLFSMSFGVTEQTFGGAAKRQTARFDKTFQAGLAKGDNFFAATGDFGTFNASKRHKENVSYPFPTVGWPATSPYVVAVAGPSCRMAGPGIQPATTRSTPTDRSTRPTGTGPAAAIAKRSGTSHGPRSGPAAGRARSTRGLRGRPASIAVTATVASSPTPRGTRP